MIVGTFRLTSPFSVITALVRLIPLPKPSPALKKMIEMIELLQRIVIFKRCKVKRPFFKVYDSDSYGPDIEKTSLYLA